MRARVPGTEARGRLRRAAQAAGWPLAAGGAAGWAMATALAAAAWTAYAGPWLWGGMVIPWDAKDFYYPVLRALALAFHVGDSGFWNPWLYGGRAVVADPQSWIFTPSFRLLAALDAAPSMRLVDVVQLLHVLAAGIGTLALGRAFGWRPVAALLAALVMMFGGVAAGRLQHSLMTVSYAHLPWALLLLHLAFAAATRTRRMAFAAAFGVVAGSMAIGRDQVAFLNCVLLVGIAAWWMAAALRREGARGALRHGLELTPALLVGIAMVTVPMLLTLDVLAASTRSDIAYRTAGYASLQPSALLTLLAPNVFGELGLRGYWGPGTLPWMSLSALGYDWNDPTTIHLYVGALPLALLATGLLRPGIRARLLARPETAPLAAGLAFALLYALGAFTPAYRMLYELLPGADLYRRPNDAAFLLNAMIALLAGAAAQATIAVPEEPRGVGRIAAMAALALGTGASAAALWLGLRFGHLPDMARSLALGAALLAAAVFVVARLPSPRAAGAWALVAILFAAGDLVAHHGGSALNARPEASIAAYRPEGLRLAAEIRDALDGPGGPYRAEIFGLDRVPGADGGGSWQNAALAYGIEQTLGYNPLRRVDYAAAVGAEQNSHLPRRRLTDLFTGYDSPLARLLGIRLVVTGRPIESIVPKAACMGLRYLGTRDGAYLYENPAALPRALLVPRALPDDGGPLPADPRATVLIEGLQHDESGDPSPGGPAGSVEILSYETDAVRIAVHALRPAWLVLNDRYHASWRAGIGGAEVPVRRANRLFRAVRVPAGDSEVAFTFEPLRLDALMRLAGSVLDDD
ncbi:MAG: hypothetical protein IT561_09800 [Alphaproteobacteria bacterium]|nr:hypothetical protein [Alphaproteobacteria bacterium]